MPQSSMQPQLTITDTGTNSGGTGTIYGGPFVGPLAIQETGGQTFIVLDRGVRLVDAVATLTTGGAPTVEHYLGIAVGQVSNKIAWLQASTLQAGSAQRHAPALNLPAGPMIQFFSVNPSSTTEAIRWVLYWA